MAFPASLQKLIQSRWPWLAASLLLTVSLFVSTTVGWFWYVDQRDSAARILSLDLLWLEQSVTLSLDDNQRMVEIWAQDLQTPTPRSIAEFIKLSDGLMASNKAIIAIDYVDKNGNRVAGLPNYVERPTKLPPITDPLITDAILHCLAMKKPVYSRVIEQYAPLWVLAVPVSDELPNAGVVLVTYDLDQLLSMQVPWWFVQRYNLSLVDRDNKQLSPRDGNSMELGHDVHKLNFGPANSGLSLRAAPHATDQLQKPIIILAIAVVTFGMLVVWLLRVLQRWLRERLMAQRALQHELRFREAMEQSLITGLMAFDTDGKIIYVNRALCDILGKTPDQLIGTSAPFDFWPDKYFPECQAAHIAMLKGENPSSGRSLNFTGANNTPLSVTLFSSPLVSEKTHGWMVSLYDTTELHKEREALAASREQLYTVLSGLDAAVFVSRIADGQLLYRNSHRAKLFQFESEADCCLMPLPGLARSTQPGSVEFQENGCWFNVQRRTILWVDGSPAHLDIVTDVSAARLAKDVERERNEILHRTAHLSNLAEFATGIAHELNQPLASISNYSAVASAYLEQSPLQIDKVLESVIQTGVESDRAARIIRSMRKISQRRAVERQKSDLLALVNEPLVLLEMVARRLDLGITVDCQESSIWVDCDPVMIEQVLVNLVRNALEAVASTGARSIAEAVTIRLHREANRVTVAVSDCGPGFDDAEQLFQPFFSTKTEGLGLGLAICRTVIESHGGTLWVEKNPGAGACFYFTLQCADVSNQNEEVQT
jgi:PAS domain S-box-containing protein